MKYRDGYKYQLAEPVYFETAIHPAKTIDTRFIELTEGGLLTVKAGYAWDGASGEIPIVRIPLTIDTKDSMRGSCAHDALYQLLRECRLSGENVRWCADRLFYDLLILDGMWNFRAKMWYRMVRRFAKPASIEGREILTAP